MLGLNKMILAGGVLAALSLSFILHQELNEEYVMLCLDIVYDAYICGRRMSVPLLYHYYCCYCYYLCST